jgi:type II secretory ATPase GspE/PulE/Tfp pilus assembly ATPase PilB-like protein
MVARTMNPRTDTPDARVLVEKLLQDALSRGASDIHLEPTAVGYEVRLRLDGLLEIAGKQDHAAGRAMVTRLMVMAQLLTYRLDIPQEGRVRVVIPGAKEPIELRLAVMPTTHGLRAAVRLPAELMMPRSLEELGLSDRALDGLKSFAAADAGMLIVTGPAGSGKTTTLYALLQHIAATSPGVSIISLEDPVERDIPGVTQIEVSPFGELTYEKALRSILRQDPQVLMLGEIRDAAIASLAVQAALSGHRLACTLHAATPASAIARLLEMGLEPYQVTSSVYAVVAQRLVRRRAEGGYKGRVPVAEIATLDADVRRAILQRQDADSISAVLSAQADYQTLRDAAAELVKQGVTDDAEIARVLGAAGKL